ncbi:trans-sulfuration enzyme family protein [Umezawaea beigongshangensis]|uniref:trans-sulfuration enzyme family protein n=1 Tax=Umezawaea beigongshangensis TaxID=2780383 RepID=UPI0018F22486|nr:aminotransferase class I/II-fold pyridoxal phosphate-dependent enzyme [Umezawaea beigongshangensis]
MAADPHTRAVHPRTPATPVGRPSTPPVYRTSTFEFATSAEFAAVIGDEEPGYSYSRIDNPTSDAFAVAVAELEGAAAGQPFASGSAAISTTLLALLSAGDHVVAQKHLYGGTHHLLARLLPRWGVAVSFVDGPAEAAAATTPATRVLFCETLSNPVLRVADLPAYAAVARRAGAVLVVDSTFATPLVCRPLELGADLVVHSATKYLGGHGDATGGVVAGSPDLLARVRQVRVDLGGSLAPDEAFLLLRGLRTLPLRVERQNGTAVALAAALRGHPAVESVLHPSLEEHPDHALAKELFDDGRFGGVVTVSPRGGRAAAAALCDGLRLARVVPSLGGTTTVVSHVATTSHRQLDDTALEAAGISPAAVRVSVGLEAPTDLVADFSAALDVL